MDPLKWGEKAQEGREKRKGKTFRRRSNLAGAQKEGQKEGDRMEDLVCVQAPSKRIRGRVRRESFTVIIALASRLTMAAPDLIMVL